MHFSPTNPEVLAVATSTGTISLFEICLDSHQLPSIKEVCHVKLADQSTLLLSLAWYPSAQRSNLLAASLSDGRIAFCPIGNDLNRGFPLLYQCHTLEAWTIAWLPAEPGRQQQLLSGGDDSAICAHKLEIQSLNSDGIYESKVQHDVKTHGAGVTAVLPLNLTESSNEQIIMTGSYDEFFRILVLPRSSFRKRWNVLAEARLHGGVWRLKLINTLRLEGSVTFTVLASCMHAGAKILTVRKSNEDNWAIEVSATFEEHESMNYASDARRETSERDALDFTIVSTSFYDKKICVWKYESRSNSPKEAIGLLAGSCR